MDVSRQQVGPAQGRRVVVVDDDSEILDAYEDVLRDAGHDVVCFPDGEKALRYLRAGRRPDVVLLDLMMPVMNGWEFIEAVERRSELAEIPVLMITASDSPGGFPVPSDRVLRKPIRIANLLDKIDDVTRPGRSA